MEQDSVETTEHYEARIEIVRSQSSPKVVVSLKLVASLDKFDKMPEMIAKGTKDIYDQASKLGLSLMA